MSWTAILTELQQEFVYLPRLLVACICGGLIGYERSRRRKEAGIRTHIIVSLGAAMMMVVSKYGFFDVIIYHDIALDASRIAANVITGISFVGAGVIFVRGVSIKGLTTAAGIWTTAGVGLSLGAGMYLVGCSTTILILIIQILLHDYLKKLDGPVYETISITYHGMPNGIELLKNEMQRRNIMIHHMKMEKNPDDTVAVTLQVSRDNAVTCTDLADILAHNPLVKSFSI